VFTFTLKRVYLEASPCFPRFLAIDLEQQSEKLMEWMAILLCRCWNTC